MNLEEEILDKPEASEAGKAKFKSRVPSNLMILLGIIHLLLGVYFVYIFFSVFRFTYREEPVIGYIFNYEIFLEIIKFNHPSFLLGSAFIIGGIGLVRHKIRGWKYGLGVSVFGIVLPVLKVVKVLLTPGVTLSFTGGMASIFLVIFIVGFFFLISLTIRNFFGPRPIDYGIAGIVVLILSLDFLLVPLLR